SRGTEFTRPKPVETRVRRARRTRNMPRKPSTQATPATQAKQATHEVSRKTGRYVFCPGSKFAHDQVFLEVLQGPKVRFVKCPIASCGVKAFLRGPAWLGANVGFTREDALAANPNAYIF